MTASLMTEKHPFSPFLPQGARVLMLGTFPPAEKRWCMPFYYPNYTNDMWRIVGLFFFGDKLHFVDEANKCYRQAELEAFLREKGIALYDTCTRIVRTKNTASDKDLEVVEQTDLKAMLRQLPECRTVVTAGALSTELCAAQFGIEEPKMGAETAFTFEGRSMRLCRMPSSSRAYPMNIEKKTEYYATVFRSLLTEHLTNP